MDNDRWIKDQQVLDPMRLHALGVVSTNWNILEYQLVILFSEVCHISLEQARILVHDINIPALFERILGFSKSCTFDTPPQEEKVLESIKHLKVQADICRINRNLLMHSLPINLESANLLARIKGPTHEVDPIQCTLKDIRQVADNIADLQTYTQDLINHVNARHMHFDERPQLPKEMQLPTHLWKSPAPTRKSGRKNPS